MGRTTLRRRAAPGSQGQPEAPPGARRASRRGRPGRGRHRGRLVPQSRTRGGRARAPAVDHRPGLERHRGGRRDAHAEPDGALAGRTAPRLLRRPRRHAAALPSRARRLRRAADQGHGERLRPLPLAGRRVPRLRGGRPAEEALPGRRPAAGVRRRPGFQGRSVAGRRHGVLHAARVHRPVEGLRQREATARAWASPTPLPASWSVACPGCYPAESRCCTRRFWAAGRPASVSTTRPPARAGS